MSDNRDKQPVIDESILEETPPSINEPQPKEGEEPSEDIQPAEDIEVVDAEPPVETPPAEEKQEDIKPVETPEQKEQRYKAQQTETQIQAAKNRNLIDKVDEASKIGEPTVEELKSFVRQDGVDWEELTVFEQSMAKKSYLAEKKFDLIKEATDNTKKIDEWASKVDTYIDEADNKPELIGLSGHEADFRKFSMQESHRGTPVDVLLSAFLHNLPKVDKKKGSLFPSGGGGEKAKVSDKITDTDEVSNLRTTNPREYKRLVKAGKIDLDL